MYLITKDFLKNLSKDNKQNVVLNKLSQFQQLMIEKESQIRNLPKGFWVRKIKNTEVYKFRLNNGDRILFTYIDSDENHVDKSKSILFLDYVNHDLQILKGKSISVDSSKNNLEDFNIYKAKEDSYCDGTDDNNIYIKKYEELGYVDLENIVSVVVEDEYITYLLDQDNEDYLYYLSKNQFECVKSIGKPIIVTGAAGSGKTTVSLHKLLSTSNSSKHTLYITYTELLYDNAKSAFKKFKKNKCTNKTDFYFLNQFYKEELCIGFDSIVKLSKFTEWYDKNLFKFKKSKNLNPIDIYAEIRGIIKGYIGLEGNLIKNLDFSKIRMISLEEYINLPNSYSIYDKEAKEIIYGIYEKYQLWLNENNLYDENDLAIKVINNINENKTQKYDYIIVDEVQDLSEIQIFMLSMLVKEPNNIMYCGDIHQIINPTFFDFSRLKNIYYGLGIDTSLFSLNKNYRNTIEIINILNKLIKDRQKLIGKTPYDYIESGIVNGSKAKLIKYDKNVIKETLEEIKDKHYCAVVVSNYEEKEKLINICEDINGRVFLPNEIKGLEYENIYCFNMISSNINHYKEIYNGKGKKNSKYRYYFNILYVGLSRAKKNLYLYETNPQNIVVESLYENIEKVHKFETSILNTSTASTESDWIKEANRLEKVDILEKTRFARNKAEEEAVKQRNKSSDEYFSKMYENIIENISEEEEISAVDKLLNKGLVYYQKRDYSNALEYYEKALEIDENYYKTYYYMANTFSYMLGGMPKSIEYYNRCIELNDKFYFAYIDKASILKVLGRNEEQIETLEKAIKQSPHIGNAYSRLVNAYDDYFMRENPLMDKSISGYNLERLKNLRQYISEIIEKETFYSWDSINKVWHLSSKAEILQEKATMRKALKNLEKNFGIHFIQKDLNKIIKKVNSNKEPKVAYLTMLNMANILQTEGKYNEAVNMYSEILNSNCISTVADSIINDSEKLYDLIKKTKTNFENKEEIINFYTAEVLNNAGRAFLALKNNKEAIECFEEGINLSPDKSTNSYLSLGDVFFNIENYREARISFNKAIQLGNIRGYIGIANISLKLNRFREGLENIDKYLEIDTNDDFANKIKIELTATIAMKIDKGEEIRNITAEDVDKHILSCKKLLKYMQENGEDNIDSIFVYPKYIMDYKL
ncbi:tetratricopeptide repeat protein [Romboutsia sp.]|uniref:tetratricopeptide repeat protein n=1 Tax=Romboutsia sp. TaxID=1965302 RepID=UPI003F3C713E